MSARVAETRLVMCSCDAQCARRDDEEPMIDESKQSSSNCKKAMHDLDGASDQDIVFGRMRDETKDAMHRALVDHQHRKGLDQQSQEQ